MGNLGNLYHQRGKLADALRCHEKAAELAPDLSVAHRNRGRVLAEMGRFLEASKALEQSLMLEPDHAETALLCAQALAESGANDRASLRCEQSIAEELRPHLLPRDAHGLRSAGEGSSGRPTP